MFKKLISGFFAIVAVFLVIVAIQPSEFRVTRTAVLNAPPAVVFAQVNNLHNWQEWSPWAKVDPASTGTYEGPPAGVGAVFNWSGNYEVGTGTMTILESHPNELIKINLAFQKPFVGTNTAEFTFTPQGKETLISWSTYGNKGFISKAVSMLINCDQMMGAQFDKGLAAMKAVVEKTPSH